MSSVDDTLYFAMHMIWVPVDMSFVENMLCSAMDSVEMLVSVVEDTLYSAMNIGPVPVDMSFVEDALYPRGDSSY